MADPNLEAITNDLISRQGCHTVILYGSRARGDAKPTSDYDVLGVRESGDVFRDARFWNGVYLDIFVYPESKILSPDATMLHLKGGVILHQKEDIATRFLARLEEIDRAGPKKLPADEVQARRVWARKMLERARVGDIEGNFRRVWLINSLLEDYFATRGRWYRGPKESFQWLAENEPEVYRLYEQALKPGADLAALQALVGAIEQE